MEYIRKDNDKVIKYNIVYNRDELDKIRLEIIENCILSTHHSGDTSYPGLGLERELVRNFHKEKIGVHEYFEEDVDVYHVEFDYIKKPELAKMIEDFLNKGNTKLLDYIYDQTNKIDDSDALDYMQQEKNELLDEVVSIIAKNKYGKIDYKKVKELLNDAEQISKNIDANRNIKNPISYIPRIKGAIDAIALLDVVDTKSYEKVLRFGVKRPLK